MVLQKVRYIPLGIFVCCKILQYWLKFSEGKIENRNSHFKIECVCTLKIITTLMSISTKSSHCCVR